MTKVRVCVIGAGASGLAGIRHAIDQDMDVTCFEQTKHIGGTWIYTDVVGKDEYGLDIHTSMYKGLRTNGPKEIMGFPDFPMAEQDDSFVSAEYVLKFLQEYSEHYHLAEKIKFEQHVVNVSPHGDSQWQIIVRDLKLNTLSTYIFDGVMVCNGHFSKPIIPKIPNDDLYRGKLLHSHDFRDANSFAGESVLIIGAGPSGMDLSCEISKVAKRVTLSQHVKETSKFVFPKLFIVKPDVKSFTENGVKFVDGSVDTFTAVIYCTGYHYTFPFLSEDCGIQCDGNFVRPLYKHIININYPTMALIGLPFWVTPTHLFDIQVRFFLKFLSGKKCFLSKEDMLADTEAEMESRWARGLSKSRAHLLGTDQRNYFDDLATLAEIEPIKPVISTLLNYSTSRLVEDFEHFRNDRFKLVDDETFVKIN